MPEPDAPIRPASGRERPEPWSTPLPNDRGLEAPVIPDVPAPRAGPDDLAGRHPRPGAEGFPSRPAHAAFASISSSVAAIAATAQRISSTVIAPTAPIRMVGAAVL